MKAPDKQKQEAFFTNPGTGRYRFEAASRNGPAGQFLLDVSKTTADMAVLLGADTPAHLA